MIEMQRRFIDYEHEHGLEPGDYYTPPPGHPLDNYRDEFNALATRLVDRAHEEKGSKR
jgi:hypothetical protein